MSKKTVLSIVGVALVAFTAWDIYDFCTRGSRSTASYLAVALNTIAVIKFVDLVRKAVRNARK